jgi:hypothetical protein
MSKQQVYELMEQGITCRKEISQRTGLTRKQVNGALAQLYRNKRIKPKETLTIRGNPYHVFEVNSGFKKHIFDGVNSIFNVGAV